MVKIVKIGQKLTEIQQNENFSSKNLENSVIAICENEITNGFLPVSNKLGCTILSAIGATIKAGIKF